MDVIIEDDGPVLQDSDKSSSATNSVELALNKLLTTNVGFPRKRDDVTQHHLCDIFEDGPFLNHASVQNTVKDLTGLYWITFPNVAEKASFLKQGHADALTVVPRANPMQPMSSKPIVLLYESSKMPLRLGVPRFWGLSHLGNLVNDRRTEGLAISEKAKFTQTLRPLQTQCVTQALQTLSKWGGTTLIADCGFGKTATSIAIACALGTRCMILCNREILMRQWIDAIRQFSDALQIGWIQGSDFDKGPEGTVRPKKDASFDSTFFSVASIDSIAECNYDKAFLASFGTIIVDEMHHIAAQSLVHVLPMFPAKNIVGLTATPNRADGLEHILQFLTGPAGFVQKRLPAITGVYHSVEVEAHKFSTGEQKEIIYRNGTLGFAQMATLLTEDSTRNRVLDHLVEKALQERRKVMFVTSHVAHAKSFYDKPWTLNGLDVPKAILAGPHQMPKEAKAKETRIVFATYSLLEEGQDDPSLDALVLAMPRSRIQQTVGRIERSHEGKLTPKVYDLIDQFSLQPAMAEKRKSFFKSRGFLQTIVSS